MSKIKAVLGKVVAGAYISWKRGVQGVFWLTYFSFLSELRFVHKAFFFPPSLYDSHRMLLSNVIYEIT